MRRGITECVVKLESVVSCVEIPFGVSTHINQRNSFTKKPDETPRRGEGDKAATAVTGLPNAGTFVMFTKDGDDDVGWPIFRRRCGFRNRSHIPPRCTSNKRPRWMSPVIHRPSSN